MRVALLGGECTGKSTLAQALGSAFSAPVATEALRDFVSTWGRVPRADEQRAILEEQRSREDALAEQPLLICDPATLMTAVYSHLYFDDDSLDAIALEQARDYALLIWCRPDIPWAPEPGQHDGPQMRQLADDRISALLAGAGRALPVISVQGTHETRLTTAIAALTARAS